MGIVASLILTCLFLFIKRKSITPKYVLWSLLLVIYLSSLLSEVVGFTSLSQLIWLSSNFGTVIHPHVINIPFSQGFDFSSFLNILVFIPLGFILIVMWKFFQKPLPTLFVGFVFSTIIEVGQLFTLYRQTDVNDLIMNTTGVLIGWVFGKYLLKWRVQRNNGHNNDWLVFFTISLISIFIFS